MEYRDFLEQVKADILAYLPEKFADAQPEIVPVVKNNDTVLEALSIHTKESNMSPNIYMNQYYEQLENGADMEDILSAIADAYQTHYREQGMDVSDLSSYEEIKDRISCRLINAEMNEQYLSDKPFTKMEDLAVIYHIDMGMINDVQGSIVITDRLMDRYGITLDDLHQKALENMENLHPHTFQSLNDVIKEMLVNDMVEKMGMDRASADRQAQMMTAGTPDELYVVTNDTRLNGAAALINDDIRQEIADKLGDFYVLPSSVHEVLLMKKEDGMDYRELENMVQMVNGSEVSKEERLSDHVYEYDAKSHELMRSDRAEEKRLAAKKEKGNEEKRSSLKERLAEKQKSVKQMDAGREPRSNDRHKGMAI